MSTSKDSPAVAEPSPSLAKRYGRPGTSQRRISRRTGRWIAVLALVAAVGLTLWFTLSQSAGQLSWKDVGYEIHSPAQAEVTFQLTKPAEASAACAVQVLSEDRGVVGQRTVVIGPAAPDEVLTPSDETQYYTTDVRTDALGVSGIVQECWTVDGPGQP